MYGDGSLKCSGSGSDVVDVLVKYIDVASCGCAGACVYDCAKVCKSVSVLL